MRYGQPDLFTKRIRKPPPALEFPVHCMIADALDLDLQPGWLWFHPPNGGERPAFINKHGKRISIEGGKLKRMGQKPGVSDFILAGPPGARLHALELKRRGETPDDDQIAFGERVRAAGGLFEWVDCFEDAINQLRAWGAVRMTV